MIKSLKISILILIISSNISGKAFAQFFNSDQAPLSVKWQVISAGGFKIIYPEELSEEAQRMANTVTTIFPYVGATLGRTKTTIPILLQNTGTIANGFVQLAPKKSEFFTTPPQYFDSHDWLNNLAVHELRHVAQFDKMTGGRLYPFPEEAYFAYMGTAVPTWFFEGDAVTIETALTQSGRGRQPSWIMPYRAQLLSGKKSSYSEAYFGSQTLPSTGYYQMGYLIAANIRKQYGAGIFDSLLTDIVKRPLRLYPFSSSLKKLTGKNTRQWFLETRDEAHLKWIAQGKLLSTHPYPRQGKPPAYETSYFLPAEISHQQIMSLKQSKTTATALVATDKDGKHEKTLLRIGYQEQPWFSYANGKVVWDEIRTDPRYAQRTYNVICIYDISGKYRKQLTFRSRLFSPTLSTDGIKIIAVAVDLANKFNLVELDAHTGKILRTLDNPGNKILQTPSYDRSGTKVTFITLEEAGKSLFITDLSSGRSEALIRNSRQQLSRPVFLRHGIAFNAHLDGIDNLYFIDPSTRQISALTNAEYGAFNVSENQDGTLLFNNYDAFGYGIASAAFEQRQPGNDTFVFFGEAVAFQERQSNVFDSIPKAIFPSRKYSALSGFVNIHSLSPDTDQDDNPGFALKSNNLLNTVDIYAGAYFEHNTGRLQYTAGMDFKALYPIFRIIYRNRPKEAYYSSPQDLKLAEWRESRFEVKAIIPFVFNSYNSNYNISLQAGTGYTHRYTNQDIPLIRTLRFPMEYNISLSHAVRTAPRDLAPRWAQYFSFSMYNLPAQGPLNGALYSAASNFYFPGILSNHSFSAGISFQKANGAYLYDNDIPTVYGYNQVKAKSLLRNTLLLNYRFPIAFPDKELGRLAYIRNLRGGIFAGYENLGQETTLGDPKTFGLELRSSMNLLRYLPVADIGARLIFVNKTYDQNPVAEFILNFNL